ncbi:MAG: carbon-nitrogen hydrolase family protein [Myxococcota bacterium]
MKLAVAQPRVQANAVPDNVTAHANLVRRSGARVIVFPELSLTGYELDAPALSPDSPALDPLVLACARTNTIALVGAPLRRRSGDYSIAMLQIDGTGAVVAYEKLFLGAEECARFTPGTAPAVLAVDGFRLGLGICKDFNTDEHAARTCSLQIDAYVCGVVKHDHERGTMEARAVELARQHRFAVAIASCAGSTGGGFSRTAGHSAIWDRSGALLCSAGPAPGEFVAAELSPTSPRV